MIKNECIGINKKSMTRIYFPEEQTAEKHK
jgi:hypothetical protein